MVYLGHLTHFFHKNILQYCDRPFQSVEDMNEALIVNWNRLVKKDDLVYHLGDFTLTTRVELIDPILARLNGRIRLIRGNHDKWLRKLDQLENKAKIEWVRPYHKETFQVGGQNHEIVMCHFPFLTWDGSYRGSIHVHGHAHGSNDHLNVGTKRLDVGVDAGNNLLHPIGVWQIVEAVKDGKSVDHHDL